MMREHRLLTPTSFGRGLEVVFDHPLGQALHYLPKVLATLGTEDPTLFKKQEDVTLKSLADNETDFGTILKPNIPALLAAAVPSPFGKGEETVFDESVRTGKELTAQTLAVTVLEKDGFFGFIKKNIAKKLFPEAKDVSLRFYKMTIYEAGGHFDFHRDTTHAANHHGTLLVEVKSAHKGGRLVFEADGEDIEGIDFSAESEEDEISWIAFYKDVRHKMEPVTEGMKIVLQFDVLVEKYSSAINENHEDDRSTTGAKRARPYRYISYNRTLQDAVVVTGKQQLATVLSILQDTFENKIEESKAAKKQRKDMDNVNEEKGRNGRIIVVPLFHLYRTESILPSFLKSVDRELFFALLKTGRYDLALSPITMESNLDFNSNKALNKSQNDLYKAFLSDPVDKIYAGVDGEGTVVEVSVRNNKNHAFYWGTKSVQYIVSRREPCCALESNMNDTDEEEQVMRFKYFLGVLLISEKEV